MQKEVFVVSLSTSYSHAAAADSGLLGYDVVSSEAFLIFWRIMNCLNMKALQSFEMVPSDTEPHQRRFEAWPRSILRH